MADNYQATLKICKIFLEYLQSVNIKIIGRLVEDKKIGRRHKHGAKVESATLATTEFAHIVILFGRGE
jgi:hypothetical protein